MGKVYLTLDEVLTRRSISRYELAKRTGIRYPIIDNYCGETGYLRNAG